MSLFDHPIEEIESEFYIKNNNNNRTINTKANINDDLDYVTMTSKIIIDEDKKKELEDAQKEFKIYISNPKIITFTITEMSIDYLYMKDLYDKFKGNNKNISTIEGNNKVIVNNENSVEFINKFKSFLLEIGISDKKFYEHCIREIIYHKSLFDFSNF